MVELRLEDDMDGIANKGDTILLNPDGTFEIQKNYTKEELILAKEEISKMLGEAQQEDIKKFDVDDEKSWNIITKLHEMGIFDSKEILKEIIQKQATCSDVTELFNKLLYDYSVKGNGDTSSIEKIINSCKKEGGNIDRPK